MQNPVKHEVLCHRTFAVAYTVHIHTYVLKAYSKVGGE